MYIFGTQYLRGATPERDQWQRDMENMRKMGFNTIRAWLVWNTIEKVEGEIDYDYINSFLTCAKEHDLNVGLLFHLHACPMWAIKKYSKYFYVNEDDLPFEPAVRANTPSGGWPGLCYDNEEVREMEERLIRGVVKETRKFDNVAFYEPMNEPHQWIDFRKHPVDMFCYCKASVKRFQEWLEKKYGDIDTLNDAWGHFFGSFDEVRPPRWVNSYTDYCDFRMFNMDNVAREIAFRTKVIKECDTKPVIAHAWGGGAITCAQLGGMAFDDWKNAKVFDKWGFSAFPQKADGCAALALGCDATRCAADGKEYWQSELTAGLNGTGLWQQGRIDDNTFNKFSLESIRHGARGLLYWQYRKERFGSEFGGFSMTDNEGGPTNLSRCAEKLCHALQDNEELFHNGVQEKAKVALVFSIRSYLTNWCSNNRTDNKFAVDSVTGYYQMLWEENIITDILHEEFFGDLNQYKLIIVPSPYAISPKLAEALKEYVKNGGTVLSDPYFGAFDKDYKLARRIPGFGFDEIFGCKADELTMQDTVVLHDEQREYVLKGNIHKELYCNVTGQTLLKYADGSPAVIRNAYGKGFAVQSGVNLGLTYSNRALVSDDIVSGDTGNNSSAAKDIVMCLCEDLGIGKNICSAEGVKVSYVRTEGDTDMLILINSESKKTTGTIAAGRIYSSARTVYGNAVVTPGEAGIGFVLEADESAIVRLEK